MSCQLQLRSGRIYLINSCQNSNLAFVQFPSVAEAVCAKVSTNSMVAVVWITFCSAKSQSIFFGICTQLILDFITNLNISKHIHLTRSKIGSFSTSNINGVKIISSLQLTHNDLKTRVIHYFFLAWSNLANLCWLPQCFFLHNL